MPTITVGMSGLLVLQRTASFGMTGLIAGNEPPADTIGVITEPEAPDGLNGWFLQTPTIFMECPLADTGAAQSYYYSLGTFTQPQAWVTEVSGSTTSPAPFEILGAALPAYVNYEDLWLYYSPDGETYGRKRITFCDDYPRLDTFRVTDLKDNVLALNYASTSGFFVVEGFRGFTETKTTNERKFRTSAVRFYADGVLWATAFLPVEGEGTQHSAILNNTVVFYHNRDNPYHQAGSGATYSATGYSAYEIAVLGEVGAFLSLDKGEFGDKGVDFFLTREADNPGGDLFDTYTIKVRFDRRDFPETSSAYYSEVENEAGNDTRTADVSIRRIDAVPIIDRIGVARNQLESGTEIIGNVAHVISVGGIEYTTDRRIPMAVMPFTYSSLYTQEDEAPEITTGAVSFGAYSPYALSGAEKTSLKVDTGTRVGYKNNVIDISTGTVEFWFAPSPGLMTAGREHTLFDFAKKPAEGSPAITADRVRLSYQTNAAGWRVYGQVTDSFGSSHSVYFQTEHVVGSWPVAEGEFHHIKLTWDFNKPEESSLDVYYDGVQQVDSTLSEATIIFGLLPSFDFVSLDIEGIRTQADSYTHVFLGCNALDDTTNCRGHYADLRLLDVISKDQQWLSTLPSGWTSNLTLFSDDNNMFKISVPDPGFDNLFIYKIRSYDVVGNKPSAHLFNTPSSRPVLIRGKYSGIPHNSETVYRFRLVDSQGEFPDLTFSVNPGSYDYADDGSRLNIISSISGKKLISVAPKTVEDRTFTWSQLKRDFMLKLKERGDSGNSFFLIDHNDRVFYGKFSFESYNEVVATVPSRYEVTCAIRGQGGYYDYRMD